MPKRLSARKLSNPISSGQNVSSSTGNTFAAWSSAEQVSTIGAGGDQVKLYNPNSFLQSENAPQPYPLHQNWTAHHGGSWPQMAAVSSDAVSSHSSSDNTINTLSNGAQNGQSDPWSWNTSDSPSPVENPSRLNPNSSSFIPNVPMTTSGSWDVPQESLYHNYNVNSPQSNVTTHQTQSLTNAGYPYIQQSFTTSSSDVWTPDSALTAYQQPLLSESGNMWQSDVNNYHWTTHAYQDGAAGTHLATSNVPTPESGVNFPVEVGSDVTEVVESSESLNSQQGDDGAVLEPKDLLHNKEQLAESATMESNVNPAAKSQVPFSFPPTLNQSSTSHLFERTDSWLSGSSLQTVNYSVGGSQDMIDASYFVPQETVDEVKRYMENLSIAEQDDFNGASSSDVSVAETNSTNQEVPSQNDVKDAASSQTSFEAEMPNSAGNDIQQNREGTEQLVVADVTDQIAISDDGVRQPPEGAAAVRPTNMIGAQATSSSNVPAFATSTTVVAQTQFDNSNELANRTPEETENIENLQAFHGSGRPNPSKPETTYSHPSNVFSGVIGIREGSPFKPPPKSTADIASVIQQELPENVLQQTLPPILDVGANLEMTPDNSEQPNDFDCVDQSMSRKTKESSPSINAAMRNVRETSNNSPSTTLWQNPEPKQANVFLVPAASSTPQQNVLIVPHLSDQQEMLDNPLGSKANPSQESSSSDNVENVPTVTNVAYDDSRSAKPKRETNFSTSSHVSPAHSDVVQQELVMAEKRTESVGAETLVEKPPIGLALKKEITSHPESHHSRSSGSNDADDSMPGRGQRPPVPGLGPVQPPSRAVSEPPESRSPTDSRYNERSDRKNEPRRQYSRDRNYPDDRYQDVDRNREIAADNYQRSYNDQRPVGHEDADPRRRRESDPSRDRLREHSRDRYRDSSRDRHRDSSRDRHRDSSRDRQQDVSRDRQQDSSRDRHRDSSRDRHRDSSRDRHRDSSRDRHRYGRDDYDRYRYRDDQYYQADRDRSRPSSRGSVDYDSDHYDNRARDHPPPPNHHSRSGYDSDREAYYQKRNYDYRDDPYRRDPHYYGDYGYGQYDQNRYYQPYYNDPYYGYSNYNYGYYAELYGSDPRYSSDPRYRAHQQQVNEYYARLGYENSDRRSVQSGRSSVNDELKGNGNKYTQDFAQSTPNQSYDPMSSYADYSSQESGYYQQPYSAPTEEKQTAARMTPHKFQIPHMKVQFTLSGQLIKILPNSPKEGQPATIEIHDIQTMLAENNEADELKNFPGPLQKDLIHKNDIMQFCVEKLKKAKEDISVVDRESSALTWELLILLIRQNGTVVGTDIAELLLKDNDYLSNAACNENDDALENEGVNQSDTNAACGKVVQDRSVINQMDEENVTRKFREYLLFGRKKEALEKAMQNGLWGHALFLASKMDNRTYNRVMTRFANSLKINDPLQTLYQLMSGRQPAAVTCVVEEKWGDWRPHLAMILSNPTEHTEVDHKSITILGDTLATRGCLQAAHFCYLMAGVEFGTYSSKSNKLVLLGANHSLPFNEFAINEAIQCTEIYEYAQSLGNSDFLLPHFQSYKFIYATRLVEFGFVQEALHYFEVIALHVCKRPEFFHPGLVTHVYELANRLKYFDPHYTTSDGERNEIPDPLWLQQLRNVAASYDLGGTVQQLQQHQQQQQNVVAEPLYAESAVEPAIEPAQANIATTSDSYYAPNATTSTDTLSNNSQYLGYQYPEQHSYLQYGYQTASDNQELQQQEQDTHMASSDNASYQQMGYQTDQQNQFSQYYAQQDVASTNYPSPQESLRKQSSEISGSPPQTDNYWDMSTNKNLVANAEAFHPNTESKRKGSASSNRSGGDKQEKKEKSKQLPSNSANAGWGFGGLISKFLPKPKNQMNLPDDRNPSIIWDEKLKRWINTDEDEEDSVAGPAAPPTDSDILKGIPTSSPPSSDGTKPPLSQEHNKFRRPLMKGSRQNYVDVVSKNMVTTVSNSGSSSLYPVSDTPLVNPSQLLIPTAVPGSDDPSNMDLNAFSVGTTHVSNYPLASTPSARQADTGQTELSRSSSQSSLAQEVQHYMAPSLGDSQNVMAHQPVPMMFNPSQLQAAAQSVPSTTSRWGAQMGRRYPR